MVAARITTDPTIRWGTPCIAGTDVSVARVVALHDGGLAVPAILEACPELTSEDVDAALEWYLEHGREALGPRPPEPGERHPRIAVDRAVQGGYPTLRGTRIPVDTVLGYWEHGFPVEEILAELPSLSPDDVRAAIAYDAEAHR